MARRRRTLTGPILILGGLALVTMVIGAPFELAGVNAMPVPVGIRPLPAPVSEDVRRAPTAPPLRRGAVVVTDKVRDPFHIDRDGFAATVADVNLDGRVDQTDLELVKNANGPGFGSPYDLNNDGTIDGADVAWVRRYIGRVIE